MPLETAQSRKPVHSRPPKSANNAGFTLVEIMVVIVIVGIVAMVAFPQYQKVQTRIEYDNVFGDLRMAVHRCRSEALGSPYPATVPTTLTIFPNGYSCTAWWDKNADLALGVKGAAITGDLTINGLGGEIRHVFFQKRITPSLEYSDTSGQVYVDFAKSRLPLKALTATSPGGFSFVISSGGYLLSPNLSAVIDNYVGGPAGIALAKRSTQGGAVLPEYSVIKIYSSGQIE